MTPDEPAVRISLTAIYEKLIDTDDKVDKLAGDVGRMVAVNDRLDSHSNQISGQGERLRKVESQVAAQWIIVGIVITMAAAALVKFITG